MVLFRRGDGKYGYYGYTVVTDYIEIVPGTWTVKLFNPGLYKIFRVVGYDENKDYLWDDSNIEVTERQFTVTTTKYVRICFEYDNYNDLSPQGLMTAQPQLEQGQATTYKPYVENQIYVKNKNGVFEKFLGENAIIPFNLSVNYTSDAQNCFAVDNIVNINLNTFNSNGFTRDAWTIIATIPAGYRPSKIVYMSAYGSDGGWTSPVAVPVMINTSGEILVFLKTTVKRILISSSYLQ